MSKRDQISALSGTPSDLTVEHVTGTKKGNKNALDVSLTTSERQKHNIFEAVRSTITGTASQIAFPESGNHFILAHDEDAQTVWIGRDSTVTVGGANAYPLRAEERIPLEMLEGNSNELWGIISGGSVSVYMAATFKE